MDKKSKSLIKYLISHGGCRYSVSFSEGIENVASEMNINTESLRATVRYLHDNGYIDYQKFAGTDKNAAFALSHLSHQSFSLFFIISLTSLLLLPGAPDRIVLSKYQCCFSQAAKHSDHSRPDISLFLPCHEYHLFLPHSMLSQLLSLLLCDFIISLRLIYVNINSIFLLQSDFFCDMMQLSEVIK